MRDIQISKRDVNPQGLTSFSILNMKTATGVSILVEKVTKAIFSKTKTNSWFSYVGSDVYQAGGYSADPQSLVQLRTVLSLAIREVAQDIIQNTPPQANLGEQLSTLTLVDLFFQPQSINGVMQYVLYMKVRLSSMDNTGSEYLTFKVDDRAW